MKKKIYYRLMMAFLAIAMVPITNVHAQGDLYAGGAGTYDDPYLIETPSQLDNMRDNRSSSFKLTADLDFTGFVTKVDGSSWVPIGLVGEEDWALQTNPLTFTGTLDGNGHTIKNLVMGSEGTDNNSLLGATAFATVMNLVMKDCSVTGASNTAIVASYAADCTFDQIATINCTVDGTAGFYVGGIMGRAWRSTFTNMYSHGGFVKADAAVGGIFGYLEWEAAAYYCYSSTAVEATRAIGGIAGGLYGATLTNSVSLNVHLTSQQITAGRIAGEQSTIVVFENNYALDTIKINDTIVTVNGGSTIQGENITMGQAKSASFWLDKPKFAINPDDEPIWKIVPTVSDFPIFVWQGPATGISTKNLNASQYKAYAVPEGIYIEGVRSGEKIEVYTMTGSLVGRYNSTSTSRTVPVSHSGIYLVKISSGNNAAVLKVMAY